MKLRWSPVQLRRLRELDAPESELEAVFDHSEERNRNFQDLESRLVQELRSELRECQRSAGKPRLGLLESRLAECLAELGFSRVLTPTIMSRSFLERMSIRPGHDLFDKVFWLDERRCLRPMLAPHLYSLLKDLQRVWELPIRIFEVGSCFRKETRGAQHAGEFTMLNLVEMGLPASACRERLEELIQAVMAAAGISRYRLEAEQSAVYGSTLDVQALAPEAAAAGAPAGNTAPAAAGAAALELGSAAWGPHPLDHPWGITEPWVGVGFGLERLLMAREQSRSLSRWVRSLGYLDGHRLRA